MIDGPFGEPEELVAGFWLWRVESLDEAVEWLRRSPFEEGELEVRRVFEPEDFGEALPADVRAKEQELRDQAGLNA